MAASPQALTILQLAESIDMGICLPYDEVQEVVAGEDYDPREDYVEVRLQRRLIIFQPTTM